MNIECATVNEKQQVEIFLEDELRKIVATKLEKSDSKVYLMEVEIGDMKKEDAIAHLTNLAKQLRDMNINFVLVGLHNGIGHVSIKELTSI